MNSASPEDTAEPPAPLPVSPGDAGAGSCLHAGLLVFLSLWITILTIVDQVMTWLMEQEAFSPSTGIPDLRWLVDLGYGLAILLLGLLFWWIGRDRPYRRLYGALALAGLFALLMAPARLLGVTATLQAQAVEIAAVLVFLLVERLLRRADSGSNWRGLWITLLAGGALAYPWVLWGAAGSAWDVLAALGLALLSGLAAARIAARAFWREGEKLPGRSRSLLEGFIALLILLVMTTGLGVNGNQGLLSITVPALGWAMAALYRRVAGVDNRPVLALLAGLAIFWPVVLIDPDELSMVISMGQGELIQWANLAAFCGLGIGLLVSLWLVFWYGDRPGQRTAWAAGAAAVIWIAGVVLYGTTGQPGLYGERLFVILKDQADVSAMARIPDYNQRRASVYRGLVDHANATQARLRSTLDRWHIAYRPYYLENAIEVQAGPLARAWLLSQPEVDRVLDNPILRPLPAPVPQSRGEGEAPVDTPWNLKTIGADRVWSELGVTGRGIVLGQSDSGAQGDHPELADSYRGQGGKNDYNWFDPWYHSASPTDIGGHGTHTLGTMLGNHVGVAPDAQWIGCVNLARNLGNPSLYLECMQFMLAPFPLNGDPLRDGRPELGAHILNNSWGCPPVEGCDPNALLPAVSALRAAGIFVVASAGNDGSLGCGSVKDPIALYAQVYSVGASDRSGQLTTFSSLGPVKVDGSNRLKPDITAPGEGVLSSFPQNTYATESGTSMAGPHVAGVVALMWSANPRLIGDIGRTQTILDETATPYTGSLPNCASPGEPNDAAGYGIVNAYEAVKMAQGQ